MTFDHIFRTQRNRDRYSKWLKGRYDRAAGLGCLSANGSYLEGYYAESDKPDFLTDEEFRELHAKPYLRVEVKPTE